MRLTLLLSLLVLLPGIALASATRVVPADQLQSADTTKTWTPPAATDTLLGRTSTDVVQNKTLSGANNTFSQLPVSSQLQTDTFIANGSTTTLTLSQSGGAATATGLNCFVDGIAVDLTTDYTYTAGTTSVVFVTAPATGQKIRCIYHKF